MTVRVFYDHHRVEELRQKGITARRGDPGTRQLAEGAATEPRSALELVEECARLRAEVDRFRRDNQRLSDEVARLTARPSPNPAPRSEERRDDSAQRFALLELE